MNFFINQAMGIGNSGVEHAQFYRAKRFDQAELPYRFVFTTLIPDLQEAMAHWDLKPEQVINMWEYLVLGEQVLRRGAPVVAKFHEAYVIDQTETQRLHTQITASGMRIVNHMVKNPDKHDKSNRILLVGSNRTELYAAATGERRVLFERRDDPHRKSIIVNIHLFNADGRHLFFRTLTQLHRYFFEQLDAYFGSNSTFIIDRGENVDDALTNNPLPGAKHIYIIHADHLANRDDPKLPLWNDHYDFLLEHISSFDRVVVATNGQREDLLVDFPHERQKIVTIPVGGIADHGRHMTPRKLGNPVRFISASRLAAEKHLDIAVKAIAAIHATGRDVVFDIYGRGGERDKLKALIKELKAEDYIHLKGLSNHLEDVYPQYDAFLSASYSEGFGLTYIEALDAGLPVVTFAARFGAIEMVRDDINGFLAPLNRKDEKANIEAFTAALTRFLTADYARLQSRTRNSVAKYQDHVTAAKWRELIDEL